MITVNLPPGPFYLVVTERNGAGLPIMNGRVDPAGQIIDVENGDTYPAGNPVYLYQKTKESEIMT